MKDKYWKAILLFALILCTSFFIMWLTNMISLFPEMIPFLLSLIIMGFVWLIIFLAISRNRNTQD